MQEFDTIKSFLNTTENLKAFLFANKNVRLAMIQPLLDKKELSAEAANKVCASFEFPDDWLLSIITLIKNPFDENASWDGCMFETFGKEVDLVCAIANNPLTPVEGHKSPLYVYTICDGDFITVSQGMYYVNRTGYLISPDLLPDNIIFVDYDSMDDEENE